MTEVLGTTRVALVTAVLMLTVVAAGLSVVSPKYVLILVGGVAFVLALLLDPALGLAIFTMLTFFGELGHGASSLKAAGALLVLSWFLRVMRGDRSGAPFLGWTRPQMFYVALGVVAWATFSLLWAADPGVARSTAFRLALNVMLFIVVPSFAATRRDLLLLAHAYVFGAALTAFYGIASGNANTDAAGRLAGGIGDPNELAALLVPAIVLAFVLIPMTRLLSTRAALIVSVGISGYALVSSQSRGGIIALAAAALAGVVWGGRQRGRILLGVVGALSAVAAYIAFTPLALGRFSSFGGGGTGRTDIWAVALKVFRAHPIQGVGIGNFPVVEGQYAAGRISIARIDLVLDTPKVTHNTYLNVLADLGLVGLVLFAGLIFLVLRALVRRVRVAAENRDQQTEALARGTLIALVGLLVAYIFISAQYEKQFWLLLGLGVAIANLHPLADKLDRSAAAGRDGRPRIRIVGS